jgi:hypothetical protein
MILSAQRDMYRIWYDMIYISFSQTGNIVCFRWYRITIFQLFQYGAKHSLSIRAPVRALKLALAEYYVGGVPTLTGRLNLLQISGTMDVKQCDCLKNYCLCLAIRFGQFGQTMGTGHYYFDNIKELFSFKARWPYHTRKNDDSGSVSQSVVQEGAQACVAWWRGTFLLLMLQKMPGTQWVKTSILVH